MRIEQFSKRHFKQIVRVVHHVVDIRRVTGVLADEVIQSDFHPPAQLSATPQLCGASTAFEGMELPPQISESLFSEILR